MGEGSHNQKFKGKIMELESQYLSPHGGLNENGSHKLIGSGNFKRCGLVGESATVGVL